MKIVQQFNPEGRHRLVINDKEGAWAAYGSPALLEYEGQLYAAFTSYWSNQLEGAVFQLFRKRHKIEDNVTA